MALRDIEPVLDSEIVEAIGDQSDITEELVGDLGDIGAPPAGAITGVKKSNEETANQIAGICERSILDATEDLEMTNIFEDLDVDHSHYWAHEEIHDMEDYTPADIRQRDRLITLQNRNNQLSVESNHQRETIQKLQKTTSENNKEIRDLQKERNQIARDRQSVTKLKVVLTVIATAVTTWASVTSGNIGIGVIGIIILIVLFYYREDVLTKISTVVAVN